MKPYALTIPSILLLAACTGSKEDPQKLIEKAPAVIESLSSSQKVVTSGESVRLSWTLSGGEPKQVIIQRQGFDPLSNNLANPVFQPIYIPKGQSYFDLIPINRQKVTLRVESQTPAGLITKEKTLELRALGANGYSAKSLPFGIGGNFALDDDGNPIIAGTIKNCIYRINNNGLPEVIAGDPEATPAQINEPGKKARFNRPNIVKRDRSGKFWISESGQPQNIRSMDKEGNVQSRAIQKLAATDMTDFEIGQSDNLYASDTQAHKIWKIKPDGSCDLLADASHGIKAPKGCALNSDETCLYIANSQGNSISQISLLTGEVKAISATFQNHGRSTQASFGQVGPILWDPTRNCLWITDIKNQTLNRLDPATQKITTVAGTMEPASNNQPAPGTPGPLMDAKIPPIVGMAMTPKGDLLLGVHLGDGLGHQIWQVTLPEATNTHSPIDGEQTALPVAHEITVKPEGIKNLSTLGDTDTWKWAYDQNDQTFKILTTCCIPETTTSTEAKATFSFKGEGVQGAWLHVTDSRKLTFRSPYHLNTAEYEVSISRDGGKTYETLHKDLSKGDNLETAARTNP